MQTALPYSMEALLRLSMQSRHPLPMGIYALAMAHMPDGGRVVIQHLDALRRENRRRLRLERVAQVHQLRRRMRHVLWGLVSGTGFAGIGAVLAYVAMNSTR